MNPTLIEPGWWVRGIATCRGVAVAGPAYVAFVPTERPKHLASELVWGIAGFVEVGARKIPPQEVIETIGTRDQ